MSFCVTNLHLFALHPFVFHLTPFYICVAKQQHKNTGVSFSQEEQIGDANQYLPCAHPTNWSVLKEKFRSGRMKSTLGSSPVVRANTAVVLFRTAGDR